MENGSVDYLSFVRGFIAANARAATGVVAGPGDGVDADAYAEGAAAAVQPVEHTLTYRELSVTDVGRFSGTLDLADIAALDLTGSGALEATGSGSLDVADSGTLEAAGSGVLDIADSGTLDLAGCGSLHVADSGTLDTADIDVLDVTGSRALDATRSGALDTTGSRTRSGEHSSGRRPREHFGRLGTRSRGGTAEPAPYRQSLSGELDLG